VVYIDDTSCFMLCYAVMYVDHAARARRDQLAAQARAQQQQTMERRRLEAEYKRVLDASGQVTYVRKSQAEILLHRVSSSLGVAARYCHLLLGC